MIAALVVLLPALVAAHGPQYFQSPGRFGTLFPTVFDPSQSQGQAQRVYLNVAGAAQGPGRFGGSVPQYVVINAPRTVVGASGGAASQSASGGFAPGPFFVPGGPGVGAGPVAGPGFAASAGANLGAAAFGPRVTYLVTGPGAAAGPARLGPVFIGGAAPVASAGAGSASVGSSVGAGVTSGVGVGPSVGAGVSSSSGVGTGGASGASGGISSGGVSGQLVFQPRINIGDFELDHPRRRAAAAAARAGQTAVSPVGIVAPKGILV